MSEDRIHRAVSKDGTEIVGRVRGAGPPLVFVHGGMGDGDTSWRSLLPFLTDSFTCYLMSNRGQGLSAAPREPDYSLDRLIEDVVAFAESIGKPVGLVGYSFGGTLAFGAAARSGAVSAVAVYEPAVFEAHRGDEEFAESLGARVRQAVDEGRPVDAARIAVEDVAREEEMAALSAAGAFERWARNVSVAVQDLEQAGASATPGPTAALTLARITVPVLYLYGSLTPTTWYRDGARHVADHAADVQLREVAGVGHFGPLLEPEPIAAALTPFLQAVREAAGEASRRQDASREEDLATTTQSEQQTLTTVISRDGTEIGYWTSGEGPPLVLVHGSLGDHTRWSALRPYLEPHFTVHAMDRRGRGASGDSPEYDFARELEDVAAVVDAVAAASGFTVDVLGSSVGATYSLAAASLTSNIRRLVLFEPPTGVVVDLLPASLKDRLDELLAAGDREGVLETAYRAVVGLSDAEIERLRRQPEWSGRVAAAHTFPRELRTPPERMFNPEQAASVNVPALLLVGGDTPDVYKTSAEAIAGALPQARVVVLDDQGHGAEMFAQSAVAEPVLHFLREASAAMRAPSERRHRAGRDPFARFPEQQS